MHQKPALGNLSPSDHSGCDSRHLRTLRNLTRRSLGPAPPVATPKPVDTPSKPIDAVDKDNRRTLSSTVVSSKQLVRSSCHTVEVNRNSSPNTRSSNLLKSISALIQS
ncbi:hypothetical protein LTS18_000477 [Coniosporium uncinatum]|uniref:Uncharacterized protein n=1 Tax=Coniosporium uncinatum TaxID=93489 RepID=A0ACC3DZ52_9PEZI|nr:hypothetical protein LTS18_000477 [Coniosporium uncinatum]